MAETGFASAPTYSRNFTFDQGSLGRNLAEFDEKVHEFIVRDLEVTAPRAEVVLKAEAPWKDRTGAARDGLWCDPWWDKEGNYSILMGHTVEYGIYLETLWNGKFQVVMPVLVAVARGFMESLTEMLHQLDNPAPVAAAIEPGIGIQEGTSQGATGHAEYVKGATEHAAKKPQVYFRNARGQFTAYKGVKVGAGHTKPTKKTATKKTAKKKTSTKVTAKTKKTATTRNPRYVFPVTVTHRKPGK